VGAGLGGVRVGGVLLKKEECGNSLQVGHPISRERTNAMRENGKTCVGNNNPKQLHHTRETENNKYTVRRGHELEFNQVIKYPHVREMRRSGDREGDNEPP